MKNEASIIPRGTKALIPLRGSEVCVCGGRVQGKEGKLWEKSEMKNENGSRQRGGERQTFRSDCNKKTLKN